MMVTSPAKLALSEEFAIAIPSSVASLMVVVPDTPNVPLTPVVVPRSTPGQRRSR